jgi:hypothetical protein
MRLVYSVTYLVQVLINEPTSSAAGAQTVLDETEDQEHARGNDSFSHNHFNSKAPSGTKSRVPAEFRRDWRSSAHNEPIEDEDDFFFDEKEDDSQATGSATSGKASRPVEQRTIEIRGLPERAIHRDVTDAIRGGAILELYLRYHDRSARVSFIEPSAAQEFLNRAKRHDIYIMGKRVRSDEPRGSLGSFGLLVLRDLNRSKCHGVTDNFTFDLISNKTLIMELPATWSSAVFIPT